MTTPPPAPPAPPTPPTPQPPPARAARALCLLVGALLLSITACSSPLERASIDRLRSSMEHAMERELADSAGTEPRETRRDQDLEQLRIDPRFLPELEEMAGPGSYEDMTLELGPTLLDSDQRIVYVTLEDAIRSAVENNLELQFARLAPAISQQQLVAAEAAFDWVFFSNLTWASVDQPTVAPIVNFNQVGVSVNQRQTVDTSVGIRKPLTSGGTLTFQHQFTYTDVETPGFTNVPDPARGTSLVVQLQQPLLRGAGSDVALAQVRLAQNAERDEIMILKSRLIQTVRDTENAYWQLTQAYADLRIIQRLLERGIDVRDTLEKRIRFDVKPSEYSDAQATVSARRTNLLRAQNLLRQASDQLKVFMNNPDLPVGSEVLVAPADRPVDEPIRFSLYDSIRTAFDYRPEVQRSLLAIDDASIRLDVAKNSKLPRLDLTALTRISGLGDSTDRAYESLTEANFIDYQAGLSLEQSIGNRSAEANEKAGRLQRMQSVLAYRDVLQSVVLEVKSSLRNVDTNYRLIDQTRKQRIAAAENLRAFVVEEETVGALTPESLNIKLSRQERLAAAEQAEVGALIDYQTSLASYFASLGTLLERNRIDFAVEPVTLPDNTSDLFPDYPLMRERGGQDQE